MYPVMLPGPGRDDRGFSSFRNPDDLFRERQGIPPDRIGWLYVRLLELLSDGRDAVRRKKPAPPLTQPCEENATAGVPVAHSR